MKKRFSVGFTIHEALNLVRERGRPIDPLVVVRCCGREYRSDIKFAKANVVSWDESHTWTDLELSSEVSHPFCVPFFTSVSIAYFSDHAPLDSSRSHQA